jgi:hypothetical protein
MFFLLLFDPTIPISQTLEIIVQFLTKGIKIMARDQPRFAKIANNLLTATRSLGEKSG